MRSMSDGEVMDLRMKEVSWIRLVALLLWTLLTMLQKAITQLKGLVENRAFEVNSQSGSENDQESLKQEATLLPPLSDEFVFSRIWPLLHQRVNISLLWRLRRVNKAWRGKVGTSLEWTALEMVRVDAPGLARYLAQKGERRPSLRERVESEIKSFVMLLDERLPEFLPQPASTPLGDGSSFEVVVGKSRNEILPERETDCATESSVCPCRWIDYGGFQGFQGRYRG